MEAFVLIAIVGVVVLVVIWMWNKIGKPYMEQAEKAAAEGRKPSSAKAAPRPVAAKPAVKPSPGGRSAYLEQALSHLPEQGNEGRAFIDPESSIYLHSSRWDELLVTDADGMPTLYLQVSSGRLRMTEPTTGQFVSVGNRKLRKMGLWTANLRGVDHYEAAIREGSFEPGAQLRLKREPENPYDKNAVAVCSAGSDQTAGHINKGMAAGLSKLIDSGAQLEVISLSGPERGAFEGVHVLIASPELMAHMLRKEPLRGAQR